MSALLVAATPVISSAREAAEADGASQAESPPAPSVAEGEIGRVVVTGSLIARKDFQAESPIFTVDRSMLDDSGTPQLEETINFMPQFTAAATGQSRQVNGPSPSAGRSTINLRGMGPARTLVLVDGKRIPPSDGLNVVDINTIPSALIESVEIISGGASAAYGSDAVGGVVNFITKQNFTGLQLDVEGGYTHRSDGFHGSISGLWGTKFGDGAGSAVVSLSYFDREQVKLGDRPFFYVSNITSRGPDGQYNRLGNNNFSAAAMNQLFVTQYGGTAVPGPGDTFSVNPDGTVYTVTSANAGGPGVQAAVNCRPHAGLGGNARYILNTDLGECDATTNQNALLPLERIGVFSRLRYDLSDDLEAYGQLSYVQNETSQTLAGGVLNASSIFQVPVTNPTIPADLRLLMNSRPNPNAPFAYSVRGNKVGEQVFEQTNETYHALAGVKGELGLGDWTWDVFASHGRTTSEHFGTNYINTQNFRQLITAPDAGNSLCNGGWDLFDTSVPLSEECRSFLGRDTINQERFETSSAEVQFQGGLFKLPAGELRAAAGIAWRRSEYALDPDRQFQNLEVMGGGVSTTTPILPAEGSQRVYEGFVEALVPIFSGIPAIEDLSANLGYRHSDYDTSGTADTWKGSLLWTVNESVMLRASKQRAIRAPSVAEIFAPGIPASVNLGALPSAGDPCDTRSDARNGPNAAQVRELCIQNGISASFVDTFVTTGSGVQQITGGNPDLVPESADSESFGIVLQPTFLGDLFSNFSLSVDYFNIELDNAINNVPANLQVQSCFNLNGVNPGYSPTHATCQTISRNAGTGQIETVEAFQQNLFQYSTSGFDAQLNWRIDASQVGLDAGFGSLTLNVAATKVEEYKLQQTAGQPPFDFNGTIGATIIDNDSQSHPDFKCFTTLTYSRGSLDIGARFRQISSMRDFSNVTAGTTTSGVGSVTYVDYNATYQLNDDIEFGLGVINATDRDPETQRGQAGLSDPALYDRVGRRYFLTATFKF